MKHARGRRAARDIRLAEAQWWTLLERAHALALSVEHLPRTQPVRVPAHIFVRARKLLAIVRAVTA